MSESKEKKKYVVEKKYSTPTKLGFLALLVSLSMFAWLFWVTTRTSAYVGFVATIIVSLPYIFEIEKKEVRKEIVVEEE